MRGRRAIGLLGGLLGAPPAACATKPAALARAASRVGVPAGGWRYADAVRAGGDWLCVLEERGRAYLVAVDAYRGDAAVLASAPRPVSAPARPAPLSRPTRRLRAASG